MLRRELAFAVFIQFAILCLLLICPDQASAQTTTFNYQGRLQDGGTNANGNYDFQFTLWDALSGGTQQPQPTPVTVTRGSVSVASGVFTVQLDFGVSALPGADRFLEISVRPAGGPGFTTLAPRQQVSSTPYAIRTLSATTADSLSNACVACVQDSQINQVGGSKVTGTIPVAGIPAGNTNYIQNNSSATAQSASLNISGNGIVGGTVSGNVFDAATQYNINGQRVLSSPFSNLFVGTDTGNGGALNSFFGNSVGIVNTGTENCFFGVHAGESNTGGSGNSFYGARVGQKNSTSSFNSFFGWVAGHENTEGSNNSSFGASAGSSNSTGNYNSFFGNAAGLSNTTESKNTFIGSQSNGLTGITNATAIGANAQVTQSNSLVLGTINGVNGATANTSVGIGTTAPAATLNVVGPAGDPNTDATMVLKVIGGKGGSGSGLNDGKSGAGILIQAGDGGNSAAASGGKGGSIVLAPGSGGTGNLGSGPSGNVGIGTATPAVKLQVFGDIRVGSSGTNGCVQRFDGTALTGACSSDVRFKRNITPFPNLLNKLTQLRPVNYYWRSAEYPDKHFGTTQSFGLVAQDVERVLPELVGKDEQGYKTVDYAKLPLMMLQAIKELKAENDSLRQQNADIGARLKRVEQTIRRTTTKSRAKRPRRRT